MHDAYVPKYPAKLVQTESGCKKKYLIYIKKHVNTRRHN